VLMIDIVRIPGSELGWTPPSCRGGQIGAYWTRGGVRSVADHIGIRNSLLPVRGGYDAVNIWLSIVSRLVRVRCRAMQSLNPHIGIFPTIIGALDAHNE